MPYLEPACLLMITILFLIVIALNVLFNKGHILVQKFKQFLKLLHESKFQFFRLYSKSPKCDNQY